MTGFAIAFAKVLGIEGGFSDRPADRGGRTMYGITERVARAHGYHGGMQDLPIETAKAIYKAQYWDLLKLDALERLSFPVALELFDTGVNMGVGVAGTFLQRSLNALNHREQHFSDIAVDGLVGPMTLAALRAYLIRRADGEGVLLKALNGLQACRYIEIAEHDASQEENAYGWLRARVT